MSATTELDPAAAAAVGRILDDHAGRAGALLPILHDVQAALGHVPAAAMPVIAQALNISRAEVYGVVTFYSDFRQQPAGRHVLRLCRGESCQALGATMLADRAQAALGIGWGQTTPDGAVTLEPVFCLGLCACGPAAMVDGRLVGRLDAAGLDALLAEVGS